MHDGDILTDSRGASWVLDAHLGRGLWGRTRVVRGEDGSFAVLKTPLTREDFGDRPDAAALAEACRRAAKATAELYEARANGLLVPLLATVPLADQPAGTEGLLLPRLPGSLEARLAGGMPLAEAIDVVLRTLHRIAMASSRETFVHGDLRPSNILLDDDGNPVLCDPMVPPIAAVREALEEAAGPRTSYLPPEAAARPEPVWDTWACASALYRAAMLSGKADDRDHAPLPLPREGLGRVALATIQDAAAGRLRAERTNPRFSSRAVRSLGRILNRALSLEPRPSPPYRFEKADELRDRLVEVDELVRPHLTHVGALQLGEEARDDVFEGGANVSFSVNVAATRGVDAEQDIVPGVALVDLDAPGDGRVELTGSRFRIHSYPTGRFRFRFELVDVPPGRYEVRVAFGIRDAEEPLQKVTRRFEVRPKPGYVPPPAKDDPTSEALPLRGPTDEPDAEQEPEDDVPARPVAQPPRAVPVGDVVAFPEPRADRRPRTPRPVAPAPPRTDPGASAAPAPSPRASAAPAPAPNAAPRASAVRATPTPSSAPPTEAPRVSVSAAPRAPSAPPAPTPRIALPQATPPAPRAIPSLPDPTSPTPAPSSPSVSVATSPTPSPSTAPTGPETLPARRPGAPAPAEIPVSRDPSGPGQGPSFGTDLRDDLFDEGRDLPRYEQGGSSLGGLSSALEPLIAWYRRDPYTPIIFLFAFVFVFAAALAWFAGG